MAAEGAQSVESNSETINESFTASLPKLDSK